MNNLLNIQLDKSILSYPGSKRGVSKKLYNYIPKNVKKVVSPFFGGGGLEFHCAYHGMEVVGYDVWEPIVEFWQCVLEDNNRVYQHSLKYLDLPSKEDYRALQKTYWLEECKWERAAMLYILSLSSFACLLFCGGMSQYNINTLNKWRNRHLKEFLKPSKMLVELLGFEDSIPKHNDDFLYLDPPYKIKHDVLYGSKGATTHKNFNHDKLAELLLKRDNWVMSYNNCDWVRDTYADCKIVELEWHYVMKNGSKGNNSKGNNSKGKELLIIR